MSQSIISPSRENTNPSFDETIRINLGTGPRGIIEPDEVLGERVVHVDLGGDAVFNVSPTVARALAAALQTVAVHVMEEQTEEVTGR